MTDRSKGIYSALRSGRGGDGTDSNSITPPSATTSEAMLKMLSKSRLVNGETGFSIDFSGMKISDAGLEAISDKLAAAHVEMGEIEAGAVKNIDEQRKVTHFTDRAEYPSSEIFRDVEAFAADVAEGTIKGSTGKKFDALILNGIGGSALGPQLLQFAINGPVWNELAPDERRGFLRIYFTDNTDTAGVADAMKTMDLETTLVLSVSKSGGTQETKNNMIAFEKLYADAGIDFAEHACAITMPGSQLDKHASSNGWMKIFPMAESIGGRTSETAIVGHLPAALTGVDFAEFLEGANKMDAWTREPNPKNNPAYLLAATWYLVGDAKGDRNMVIVPYADRLLPLSRYLQQLVMESLGKEKDRDGNVVNQGLNVFGNKGGTDAHAFIQQLNDGRDDFFATFIEVYKDTLDVEIENGVFMGDYLHGFQAGLADALQEKGRQVIQMAIRQVDAANLGALVALYERAVAFYAELININAFHQPGVEAYKKASKKIIALLAEVNSKLPALAGSEGTAAELAEKAGVENVAAFEGILAKAAENPTRPGNSVSRKWSGKRDDWIYRVV